MLCPWREEKPMALAVRAGKPGEPGPSDGVAAQAQVVAAGLLVSLPDRWRHTIAVAERAEELTNAVEPDDRETLCAAAWLHDVGYSPHLAVSGFHPLDGAGFLKREGWSPRLCALVAHHSGARFVARVLGLDGQLGIYPDERSLVSDALAYADQTVGLRGERLTIEERLADKLHRHGPNSPNAAAHHIRAPYLLAAARRVEQCLRFIDLMNHSLGDLVDFALARIAEEQAGWDSLVDGGGPAQAAASARLAECQARRENVKGLARRSLRSRAADTRELQLLALPYYDHPDYQPSWRPASTMLDL